MNREPYCVAVDAGVRVIGIRRDIVNVMRGDFGQVIIDEITHVDGVAMLYSRKSNRPGSLGTQLSAILRPISHKAVASFARHFDTHIGGRTGSPVVADSTGCRGFSRKAGALPFRGAPPPAHGTLRP